MGRTKGSKNKFKAKRTMLENAMKTEPSKMSQAIESMHSAVQTIKTTKTTKRTRKAPSYKNSFQMTQIALHRATVENQKLRLLNDLLIREFVTK